MHGVDMSTITHKLRGAKLDRAPSAGWRTALALGAIVLGAGLISACSNPARYRAPWCTNVGDGGVNECSYTSFEQCQATVSGVGGFCTLNRSYSGDGTRPRRPVPRSQ